MWFQRKLFWISVAVAATLWLLGGAIHHSVFGEGPGLADNLVSSTAKEWWMRSLAGLLLIAFGPTPTRASQALLRAQEERRAIRWTTRDESTERLPAHLCSLQGHWRGSALGSRGNIRH